MCLAVMHKRLLSHGPGMVIRAKHGIGNCCFGFEILESRLWILRCLGTDHHGDIFRGPLQTLKVFARSRCGSCEATYIHARCKYKVNLAYLRQYTMSPCRRLAVSNGPPRPGRHVGTSADNLFFSLCFFRPTSPCVW